MRSILDGHIVLSRKLASANQYPAIDVLASVSRVMSRVVSREHMAAANAFRAMLAKYQELELLVQIGEYKTGNDPVADVAIQSRPSMLDFLAQPPERGVSFDATVTALSRFGRGR